MPHRRAPGPNQATTRASGEADRHGRGGQWDEDPYGYGRRSGPSGADQTHSERWDVDEHWDEDERWNEDERWDDEAPWDGTERWDEQEQAAAWAAHDEWRQPQVREAVQRRPVPVPRRDLGQDLQATRDWVMRASGLAEAAPGVDRAARLLECGLALIFYWFGLLKLFPHVSPAEELGGRTVEALTLHLLPFRLGVTILGLLEIGLAIGVYLIPRYTWVLWLVLAHLVGTFTPFLLFPGMALGGVPGSLSLIGQYIVKNVVLMAAVWFLIQHHRTIGLKLRRR